MRIVFWFCAVVGLTCKNEVLSLIFLLVAGVWGLIKLFEAMNKGGYR